MTCVSSQKSSGYLLFIHGTLALARRVLSLLKPASAVCSLVKLPRTQLCHRAPLEWDLYLQTETPAVGDTNSVFAANFTSPGFIDLVCNMGKCEINLAFTSLVWCTRRRELEPGLTISGIIKTVFVPPWLTLCLLLCFPLVFLVSLIWLPLPSLSLLQSFLQSQCSALICSLV